MKKNTASQVVVAQLINKADGTPCTSGTTTCYVLGDGGTQATGSVGAGACTHEGNGLWSYAPAQAETNYDHVAFTFVNTAAVNATVQIYPAFPQTGDGFARLGAPAGASLSADVAAVKAETAAIVADTNELQTDWVNGGRLDTILDARASQTSVDDLPTNAELATALGTADDAVLAQVALVRAKTDNLPSDPADASDISAAFGTVNSTLGTIAGYLDTEIAAIKAKTDGLPTDPADASVIAGLIGALEAKVDTVDTVVDAIKVTTDKLDDTLEDQGGGTYGFTTAALQEAPTGGSAPTTAQIADKLLGRSLAGGADGGRTVQDALRSLRNKSAIAAGTLTVYEEDDATSAWTATVTTTAGDPLSAIDPA